MADHSLSASGRSTLEAIAGTVTVYVDPASVFGSAHVEVEIAPSGTTRRQVVDIIRAKTLPFNVVAAGDLTFNCVNASADTNITITTNPV